MHWTEGHVTSNDGCSSMHHKNCTLIRVTIKPSFFRLPFHFMHPEATAHNLWPGAIQGDMKGGTDGRPGNPLPPQEGLGHFVGERSGGVTEYAKRVVCHKGIGIRDRLDQQLELRSNCWTGVTPPSLSLAQCGCLHVYIYPLCVNFYNFIFYYSVHVGVLFTSTHASHLCAVSPKTRRGPLIPCEWS